MVPDLYSTVTCHVCPRWICTWYSSALASNTCAVQLPSVEVDTVAPEPRVPSSTAPDPTGAPSTATVTWTYPSLPKSILIGNVDPAHVLTSPAAPSQVGGVAATFPMGGGSLYTQLAPSFEDWSVDLASIV